MKLLTSYIQHWLTDTQDAMDGDVTCYDDNSKCGRTIKKVAFPSQSPN